VLADVVGVGEGMSAQSLIWSLMGIISRGWSEHAFEPGHGDALTFLDFFQGRPIFMQRMCQLRYRACGLQAWWLGRLCTSDFPGRGVGGKVVSFAV
jgi:hypothetical protein